MKKCDQGIITRRTFSSIGRDVTFLWLLRVRWAILVCQLFMVTAAIRFFHIQIPLRIALFIIGIGLLSNAYFSKLFLERRREIPGWFPTLVMFCDILLMTILFFQVVSIFNPLSILYIIYIVLGALLLKRSCSYILTVFTATCYSLYFYFATPLPIDQSILTASHHYIHNPEILTVFNRQLDAYFNSHSYFMFFIFFLVVLLIVFPVGQIKTNIEKQEKVFKELDDERLKNEKLATLASFAAGAAHEFSTPLSTIAVASGEMLYHLDNHNSDPSLIEDANLIREQVERCRAILFQMSTDSGKLLGENVEKFNIQELVYEAIIFFKNQPQKKINFHNKVGEMHVIMPARSLKRTVKDLMKNALEASTPGIPVDLFCWKDNQYLYLEVKDRGKGMDKRLVKKAIEPFYTSKGHGNGMGLGLYLAKILANRFGGDLYLTSTPLSGTTATLTFALNRIHAEEKTHC